MDHHDSMNYCHCWLLNCLILHILNQIFVSLVLSKSSCQNIIYHISEAKALYNLRYEVATSRFDRKATNMPSISQVIICTKHYEMWSPQRFTSEISRWYMYISLKMNTRREILYKCATPVMLLPDSLHGFW